MTGIPDDRLMIRAAEGDETALRMLVERWERPVFAFLVRMLGSPEEAEDLCQDTFMRVIASAGKYRPEGRFQGWLFKIAGNLARSRLRRRRLLRWLPLANEHHETPAAGPDPLNELERGESRARVRDAVSRLPDRQREALILKQYHDLSYQEIADAMGATVGSVQMLLHRAMSALRRDLSRGRSER